MTTNKKLASKYDIQGDLNRIWFKYYTKPITTKQRIKIAEAFINRYTIESSTESHDEIIKNIEQAPRYDSVNKDEGDISALSMEFNHPQLSKAQRYDAPSQTLAEILTYFILRPETDKGSNVKGRELELAHDDAARDNNLHIYHGKDIDTDAGEKVPAGYITEDEYVPQMITPRNPVTARRVKAELEDVKSHPDYYATTFEEDHDKEYDDSIRRIKRLDLERVRTCHECDDGFYARDLRRKVCDRQVGLLKDGKQSDKSACELNYKRNEEMWRQRTIRDS